jgi:hypothetical protein
MRVINTTRLVATRDISSRDLRQISVLASGWWFWDSSGFSGSAIHDQFMTNS